MRLKISNRNSSLGNIASKLGEPKALSQAGALFLLALAHESAKAKAYEPLNAVQQLLGERKALPVAADEGAQTLAAEFEGLVSAWAGTVPDAANLDEAFAAMAHMSASEVQVVLAQSGINRAPVSDAAVDYIDPTRFTPMKEVDSLQSVPAPVAATAPVADEGALALKLDPELALDPNALAATSAGPLLLPVPLLLGAGAVALAGGGGVGASGGGSSGGGGGGSTPANNVAILSNDPGKDIGKLTGGATTATGKFNVQDADAGQAAMQTQTNAVGKYGTFNLAADGAWKYTLNPDLAAYKALPKDVLGTESFVVKSLDGSAQKTVTVDVLGINDAPVISSAAQSGAVQEDGTLKATGQVVAIDVDTNTVMTYAGSKAGTYGSFQVAADGKWVYELNNAMVQNFPASKQVTETFTVSATDDQNVAVMQDVVITIKGSNDLPTVTGANAVTADETNSPLQIQGQFTVKDVDTGESGFQTQTINGEHGSLSVLASGQWIYTAKESFDSLNVNNKLIDTLSLKTADGTAQALTLTIQGTNDNPTVSAALTSAVNEGDQLYQLDLLRGAQDIDAGDLAGLSVVAGSLTYTDKALTVNAPKGFTLNGNSLSIDPKDPSFDSLAAGVTKSIELNYNIRDSFGGAVSQKATVNITGTNDAPKVVDIQPALDKRTITEMAGVTNVPKEHTLSGTFRAVDPDATSAQKFTISLAASNSANPGKFEIASFDASTGDGSWTYTIQDSALDYLAAGNNVTISNKFSVSDGNLIGEGSIDVLLLGADTTSV